MLFLSVFTAAVSLTTFIAWVVTFRRALNAGKAPSWTGLFFALFAAFVAAVFFEWGPSTRAEIILEYAGAAIMASTVILLLRAGVRMRLDRVRLRQGFRRAAVTIASALGILAVGHAVRVTPRVAAEGWFAGVPSPFLVLSAQYLPHEVIAPPASQSRYWSLKSRWERGELWTWEKHLLESRLEQRLLNSPSASTFAEVESFILRGERFDSLAARYFELKVNAFCDASDSQEREQAASNLYQFLPTNGKIYYPYIGAEHGPRVTKGRVPRLVELTADPDGDTWRTVVDLLAVCGDDAAAALPALLSLTARDYKHSTIYSVVDSLQYLSKKSPAVGARLVEMSRGSNPAEWLLSMQVLHSPDWHDSPTRARLIEALRSDDSAAASLATDVVRGSPHANWSDLVPVLFEQLNRNRSGRAQYLDAFPTVEWTQAKYGSWLSAAFSDPDPYVRRSACWAVTRCADDGFILPGGQASIEKLVHDPDVMVSQAATWSLGELIKRQQSPAEHTASYAPN